MASQHAYSATRPGDANCDGEVTAADLPALIQRIPTNDFAHCPQADVTGDGVLDGADVSALVATAFSRGGASDGVEGAGRVGLTDTGAITVINFGPIAMPPGGAASARAGGAAATE